MKLRVLFSSVLCLAMFFSEAQINERFKTQNDKSEGKQTQEEQSDDQKQDEDNGLFADLRDRLLFGGNVNLTFGTNTFIYVAPTIAYKVTDNFLAGGGFVYQYARYSQAYNTFTNTFQNVDFESKIYGPKLLLNYLVADRFYGGAQFEYLNHDLLTFNNELERVWTSVLFLEAGYIQPIGDRGFFQIGLKYNVLHDFDSPYGSAILPAIGIFF